MGSMPMVITLAMTRSSILQNLICPGVYVSPDGAFNFANSNFSTVSNGVENKAAKNINLAA